MLPFKYNDTSLEQVKREIVMSNKIAIFSLIFVFCLGFSTQVNSQDKSTEVDVIFSKLSKVLPENSVLMAYPYADTLSVYGERVTAKLNEASDVIGGKAFEVSTKEGKNHWDSGVTNALFQEVKKGDVLHFTFFAKALKLPARQELALIKSVGVQKSSAPYNALFGHDVYLSKDWQSFTFAGIADSDYAAGELQATFQIATADQEIAFGPLLIFNVGKGVDIASLPYVQ